MRTTVRPLLFLLGAGLVGLTACDATQPRPLCRAQQAKYAARYALQGSAPASCMGKVLTGEIVNLQYYRPKMSDPNGTPSVAIEPQSVFDLTKKAPMFTGKNYSQGAYDGYEPAADDVCRADELSETNITGDGTTLGYKWSNFQMMVKPLANAIHFGADLTRRDGDCMVNYKVTAVYPAIYCGDGTKEETVDGKTMTVPDPTTGKPVAAACEATYGSGIHPGIELFCDASADGLTGSHLCLPKDDFPALKD